MKIRKSRTRPWWITCGNFGESDSDLPSLFRQPLLSICIVPGWKRMMIHKDFENFVTNTLRRSVLRFWAGVPLQENAEKASHRDFLRASKLRSLSCGSLDKRVCDTSDLGSFDWSMQKYWDIRWSTNLLKLECERIRSQRARFCPGNLGGIPSMWTWAGRRSKGQPRNLIFHKRSKEQPRNQRLAELLGSTLLAIDSKIKTNFCHE